VNAVSSTIEPSGLLPADLPEVASIGLRMRRLRTALSALGIALGIASIVAVMGISDSSKAGLIAQLDKLVTSLLEVTPGQSFAGDDSELPSEAQRMIASVDYVEHVAAVRGVDASIFRNQFIPEDETGGLHVQAATPDLPATTGVELSSGRFLNDATIGTAAAVLGAETAAQLGIRDASMRPQVWIGGHWFTVVGILRAATLAPGLDRSALIGFPIAKRYFETEDTASTIYVRAAPEHVEQVRDLLARTANPEAAEEVKVSRPSDALQARAAAKSAFTSLFLILGAVALLVGGVGIANVMFVSVLERRPEIGLRRALGATRRHIWLQFSTESLLLSAIGGGVGVIVGGAVTFSYAASRGWAMTLPPSAIVVGLGAAMLIGFVAGSYPASRAARLSPTEALRVG
jgi:putative ABC transport system permease protein